MRLLRRERIGGRRARSVSDAFRVCEQRAEREQAEAIAGTSEEVAAGGVGGEAEEAGT